MLISFCMEVEPPVATLPLRADASPLSAELAEGSVLLLLPQPASRATLRAGGAGERQDTVLFHLKHPPFCHFVEIQLFFEKASAGVGPPSRDTLSIVICAG